jgi:hypothetical protein
VAHEAIGRLEVSSLPFSTTGHRDVLSTSRETSLDAIPPEICIASIAGYIAGTRFSAMLSPFASKDKDMAVKLSQVLRASTFVFLGLVSGPNVAWGQSHSAQPDVGVCDELNAPDVTPGLYGKLCREDWRTNK